MQDINQLESIYERDGDNCLDKSEKYLSVLKETLNAILITQTVGNG